MLIDQEIMELDLKAGWKKGYRARISKLQDWSKNFKMPLFGSKIETPPNSLAKKIASTD